MFQIDGWSSSISTIAARDKPTEGILYRHLSQGLTHGFGQSGGRPRFGGAQPGFGPCSTSFQWN